MLRKKLAFDFLSLSSVDRFSIGKKLGLIKDGDKFVERFDREKKIFQRAAQRDMIDELRKEVDSFFLK